MTDYPQMPGQQPYGAAPTGGEPPLDAPWYGISFPKAFARFWKKYAVFSGRASRSEYWWWYLWNVIITAVLSIIVSVIAVSTGDYTAGAQATSTSASAGFHTNSPSSIILGLWGLATLIPTIAIQVRRLHDANLRAWWILLQLIPILGGIVVLIMTILPSNPEGARFDRR
jgi:uncharacterized membrane protein YhaH (DUF805 family)